MPISRDATEYTLQDLQPATKYEIGVKSVRGREESEVASITAYTGGKELLVGSEQSNSARSSPAQGWQSLLALMLRRLRASWTSHQLGTSWR